MDCRRFSYGGGDVDFQRLARHQMIDYYNLPLVGGIHATLAYPELQEQVQQRFQEDVQMCHARLRRQFVIPDSAFDIFFQYLKTGTNIIAFETFTFKMDYSRDNRQKQLLFQRRLDLFTKVYYGRRLVELTVRSWQQLRRNQVNNTS
ncbi:uncharacterized protein LOC119662406 [Teleopsis dalmanni]|uniref:uncharacterized protein LOC119662406 n=1 Tax=Teleopsis dalmanni TaxID=139649 RepID=UPI0018CF58FE|nr:uncharacterized protein LOC119662406 [Teleopsis dalmanni]